MIRLSFFTSCNARGFGVQYIQFLSFSSDPNCILSDRPFIFSLRLDDDNDFTAGLTSYSISTDPSVSFSSLGK